MTKPEAACRNAAIENDWRRPMLKNADIRSSLSLSAMSAIQEPRAGTQ